MIWKGLAVFALIIFYSIYFGKMIAQKRKGIQTDQIAKGKEKGRRYYIELIIKIATIGIVGLEVVSILMNLSMLPDAVRIVGVSLAFIGDIIFGVAVWTMRDSWRAGIPEKDKTEMVTEGIYSISRNPAFFAFDLVYIGILLLFFNPVLLIWSLGTILMLHLQILQEEEYLVTAFGEKYVEYRKSVGRYLGRRKC